VREGVREARLKKREVSNGIDKNKNKITRGYWLLSSWCFG
jgi:hypothetical protein